jgi:hypothetical protein
MLNGICERNRWRRNLNIHGTPLVMYGGMKWRRLRATLKAQAAAHDAATLAPLFLRLRRGRRLFREDSPVIYGYRCCGRLSPLGEAKSREGVVAKQAQVHGREEGQPSVPRGAKSGNALSKHGVLRKAHPGSAAVKYSWKKRRCAIARRCIYEESIAAGVRSLGEGAAPCCR